MPIRTYKCKCCDTVFDNLELGGDDKPQCNSCSSLDVTRQITAAGGYTFQGGNGASTTPKGSGSFKRTKR